MLSNIFGESSTKTQRTVSDTIATKLSRNPSGLQMYQVIMAVNVIISCVLCWLLNEYTRKVVDCTTVLGQPEEEDDIDFNVLT
ncbi:hypothetical protein QE152_g39213 [Popillia japonica]|uniref:Uncharacterized protein n=1 Tax=Popillia japonica TaxID=7064 RepID=A0AAW1HUN5_POPJA